MANEITGVVKHLSLTENLITKAGKPYQKRLLVLDCTPYDRITGQRSQYENLPAFEFLNEQCQQLDVMRPGDVVRVEFFIQGDVWTTPEGETKYITRLKPFKVEMIRVQQPAAAPQGAQPMTPQPAAPQPTPQAQLRQQPYAQPAPGYGAPTPQGQQAYNQTYPQQGQPQQGGLPF
jgi:single-stranded DNA-binding protein